MKPLKSIEAELADCRKAWKPYANKWRGVSAWCLHHRVHCELLREPPEDRIDYILSEKPEREHAIRFRNFRPVRVKLPSSLAKANAALDIAYAAWDKAYAAGAKAYAAWAKAYAARDKAYAACESELQPLHAQDWPDNSWNGRSIFP